MRHHFTYIVTSKGKRIGHNKTLPFKVTKILKHLVKEDTERVFETLFDEPYDMSIWNDAIFSGKITITVPN